MKIKWLILLLLIIPLTWLIYRQWVGEELGRSSSKVQLIEPIEARELITDPLVFVVDVHTPEQEHIPGTDAFIPFDQVVANQDKFPEDKATPVLVYCRTGSMSTIAAEELVKLGYTTVYDLEGGIMAYREQNVAVSVTPEIGELGTVIYGEVPLTEFTLTNFTPNPLTITRLSTSCGCTKAEINKRELQPYERATISVSFDPAVHQDDTDVGDITRSIYIETDNPNFELIEATITGTVIKP
jgi:rhodanese-related sulfurtransferase